MFCANRITQHQNLKGMIFVAENEKRYYWLKLKRDFFKRHDIQIVESMPNGKDYILFYLKLLCESVDHDGNLRFNEQIPYSEQMLSTITNTNIDVVRGAINVFTQLHMIELLDNGTYFMNEVQKMIGSAANTDNANRQRRYRERQRQISENSEQESKGQNPVEKEAENKDLKEGKPKEVKHKYGEYQHVLLTDSQFQKLVKEYGELETQDAIKFLDEYIQMKGYKAKDHSLVLKKWVFNAVKEEKNRNNTYKSGESTVNWDAK